jgi:uncharacterized membrane protein YraQ (UPF0718 family)
MRFAEKKCFQQTSIIMEDKKLTFMPDLLIATFLAVIVSLLFNRKKTLAGLKMGLRMFLNMLPPFITVLIGVSFVLALLPKETLIKLMGAESGFLGFAIAAILGSIALIPGFVSYPLSAVLIKNGVSFSVVSVFITTLMMVGIVTLPLEKKYFGWRVTLMRNGLCFVGALVIGALMSLFWGLL